MRIAVVAGFAPSLLNFRRELLMELVRRGHSVVAMAPEDDAEVRRGLEEIGVAFHTYPLVRNAITPTADLKTVVFLSRFFRRQNIDLTFSYTIKPIVFGATAAAAAGVPHITAMVTGLGYAFTDVEGLKRRLIRSVAETLYRRGLWFCESIIFQNDDDEAFFVERRLIPKKATTTIVNGSGVDIAHHRPQTMPSGPPHFLTIARLLREKGLREFGAAAQIVREQIPEATFEVVGPEDESPGGLSAHERRIAETSGVVFSGPTTDVREALRRSTCFVLASYREGTPRTVLEAMAAERPIITTDVPGCRQTTEHGVTGVLVPAQDAAALATAMLDMAKSEARARDFAQAARQRVVTRYDVRTVASATVDAILGQGLAPANGDAR